MQRVTKILKPYAPHAIPHPAGRWARWLAAWREPRNDLSHHCPVCGDILKTRKGKRGIFLGCRGYPQCTFTRNYVAVYLPPTSKFCPICDVGRVVSRVSARGNEYKQCADCEAFIGSRFITAEEKPKVAADKAARKEKKRIAKARKTAKGRKAQREMVVQKPVEGWTPADWYGEEWDATGWMPEKWLAKRGL